jgi:hypothetical protein
MLNIHYIHQALSDSKVLFMPMQTMVK